MEYEDVQVTYISYRKGTPYHSFINSKYIIYILYILGYILHILTLSLISVTDICYRELPSENFSLCINELRV